MKFGKIYDYRNKEEAKKLIGKRVLVSDCLFNMEKTEGSVRILLEVFEKDNAHPFLVDNGKMMQIRYQFIREIEEEKPIMTYRQLSEWLAKGFGELVFEGGEIVSRVCHTFKEYFVADENKPVFERYLIRPWGSDEWVKPTLEIYERDCKKQ